MAACIWIRSESCSETRSVAHSFCCLLWFHYQWVYLPGRVSSGLAPTQRGRILISHNTMDTHGGPSLLIWLGGGHPFSVAHQVVMADIPRTVSDRLCCPSVPRAFAVSRSYEGSRASRVSLYLSLVVYHHRLFGEMGRRWGGTNDNAYQCRKRA